MPDLADGASIEIPEFLDDGSYEARFYTEFAIRNENDTGSIYWDSEHVGVEGGLKYQIDIDLDSGNLLNQNTTHILHELSEDDYLRRFIRTFELSNNASATVTWTIVNHSIDRGIRRTLSIEESASP